MGFLDNNGLTKLWSLIKAKFALKSHTHTQSDITDFDRLSEQVKSNTTQFGVLEEDIAAAQETADSALEVANASNLAIYTMRNGYAYCHEHKITSLNNITFNGSTYGFTNSATADCPCDWGSVTTFRDGHGNRSQIVVDWNNRNIMYFRVNSKGEWGGWQVYSTPITGLSISGRNITYTKADGSTGTLTTQDEDHYPSQATADTLGLIKIGFTKAGKSYPVQLDANGRAYVHVPWVDSASLEADLERFDEAISDLQYDMGLALLSSTVPIEYGKDLNSYITNGIYRLQVGVTNQPAYTDYGTMVVFRNTVDTGFQIVSGYNQGTLYYRGFNTGGFDAWCKLSGFDNPNDYGFNYIDNMVSNQNDNFKVRGVIHTKRLAGNILEVEFYGIVEAKDSSDSFSYSFLHPNVISSLKGLTVYTNENLMYASEVTYYETTGEINKDKTGYGGMMFFSGNDGFIFARIYDTNGNGGGWGSATLTVGTYVKGKVYYKVS